MTSASLGPANIVVTVARLHDVRVDHDGHPALRGVSARAEAGRVLAVVGANGSGKSTLLGVAAGLVRPAGGTVAHRSGTRIAYVAQSTPDAERLPLTVTDLVMMGRWRTLRWWRPTRREDRRRVAAAIDAVGLTTVAHRTLGALSGGQRQRAFLGQALAQDADLVLLDEPMSGLDADSRVRVASAIAAVAHSGAAVIVVTHDLGELGDVDSVLRLHDGRAVHNGRDAS